MKKQLLFLFLLMMPFVVQAQQMLPKFGYFNLSTLMKAVPEYATAQKNIADLRVKYDEETKRSEDEFNKKYEEFLDGQRDFAPTIMQKRQAELQDMMEKNIAFKKEAQRLLAQAEQDAMAPVKGKVLDAIRKLGQERGYAFILNADGDALPYVDMAYGDNLNDAVVSLLARGGK
ncbi:OmpH family outer membrane protein [Hoylesella buccalis]|uniref:OmpH family outer membrane protein n=1 Tax=Hoylesella buccalis TaxID=28127 RepID=UPI00050FD36D|nr:membrane protein [Hoylesella buccalis DNF00985]